MSENSKNKKEFNYLFLIILLIAFALRSFTLFQPWFLNASSDPFFHYAFAREYLKDHNLTYSLDGNRPITQLLGMYWIPIILSFTPGISLLFAFKLIPILLGVLTVYLAYKLPENKKVAVYFSSLLAVCLPFIHRTISGNYRGEIYVIVLLLYSLLIYKKMPKTSLLVSLLSMFFWNGYVFVYLVFLLNIFIISIIKFFEKKDFSQDIKHLILSIFSFEALYLILRKTKIIYLKSILFELNQPFFYFAFTLPLFLVLLKNEKLLKKKKIIITISVSAVVLGFFILKTKLEDLLSIIYANQEFYKIIGELKEITLLTLWQNYYLIFPLALIGLFFYFKNIKKENLFSWVLASFFLLFAGNRFLFLTSIPFCYLAGLTLSKVDIKKEYVLFLILTFQTSAILPDLLLHKGLANEWLNALNWIKGNTPKNSTFFCDWSYGSKIQAVSQRQTITDSVLGQNVKAIKSFANFSISNTNTLKKIDFDYLLLTIDDFYQFPNYYLMLNKTFPGFQVLKEPKETVFNNFPAIEYNGDSGKVIMMQTKPLLAIFFYKNAEYINKTIIYQNGNYSEFVLPKEANPIPGCFVLLDNGALFLSPEVCDSNYVKLFFFENSQNWLPYELVYKNDKIKIFEKF